MSVSLRTVSGRPLGRGCLFVPLVWSLLALFSPPARAHAVGHEFIPPEHWSYHALVRFEALGLVALPSERPFTRSDLIGFVEQINRAIATSRRTLGARARFDLARLEEEFASEEAKNDPNARYDPPVVFLEQDPLRVEGDLDFSIAPERPFFDDRWWVFGISNLSAKLHLGEWVTYDMRYRLTYAPERDVWRHKSKPSPREKSWNGLAALYERAYVVFRWKPLVLFWGRDYEDWGPSEGGNLIVSKTAGSLDKLGGRFAFRSLRLSFFHSSLSVGDPRRTLSAHRLEFDVRDVTFGLSETVLYVGRGIDPVYALPLSAFYANQFNERGDDNIIWAVDAKYRVGGGVLLYGSLLIDDFQFEREDAAPDKLGFDLGGRVALCAPVPLTIGADYRYVDIYTYTHRDSLKYHVAESGDPLFGDPPLGAAEGPDTDVLTLRAEYFPGSSVTTTGFVSFRRKGEGNDYREHRRGLDPSPPFPSGVVEKTVEFGFGMVWEFGANSSMGLDLAHSVVTNRDHSAGKDDDTTMIRGFLTWDL